MLDPKKKKRIIQKFKIHEDDTGSSQVQIAILTEEIKELTEHLKIHRKDFSSRRGLIRKVNQRRRLLRFLEKDNPEGFNEIVAKLKIKIKPSVFASLEEEPVAQEENQDKKDSDKETPSS